MTKLLLQKAGAKYYAVKGSLWQKKGESLQLQEEFIEDYGYLEKKCRDLQNDKSVATFLQQDLADEKYAALRFSLKNYVEGYYAADIKKSSTAALCEEMATEDEEQYRIEGGYACLLNYLQEQCRMTGVSLFLSHPVTHLRWKAGIVEAVTEKGPFIGMKALLTVSIGVLQKEGIRFLPALPHVKEAVDHLGFGHVIKVILVFEDAFWKKEVFIKKKEFLSFGFLFSEEKIPTWWTHYPKENAVLTGWLGGPRAEALKKAKKEDVVKNAIDSLSALFNLDVPLLQKKLKAAFYYNWSADEHIGGAYSYDVVGGEMCVKKLQQPVEATIYFAGEGLHQGKEIGTVEGALQSGREMAHRIIASFTS